MSKRVPQRESRHAAALATEIITLLYRNAGNEEFAQLQSHIDAAQDAADKKLLQQSMQMVSALRERFDEYQRRERGLTAVIETAQDLTAIHDIDRVLQAIVHRARKLMSTDVGYLSIYDKDKRDFYVRATDGAFSEKFKQIRVGRDIGICGYVARNKSPYSSAEYDKDPRFAHTGPIDTAVTEEGIRSILGVPLLSATEVIGVLFVGDRYVRSYGAWEMSMLSTLAAHASVAIESAGLFEQAQIALKQASEANALLMKQTADTQSAADAHEQLTALVAKGGDLNDICKMVARMLAGHVMVIDEGEQPICASAGGTFAAAGGGPAAVGDGESFYTRQDKMHAALVESRIIGRSVTAFVSADEVCRVSAVVGSRGLLGGLIIRTRTELNEVEVRIFERSSMVAGVVLLSQERNDYAAKQEIPGIFRGLLHRPQHDLDRMSDQARRHGLDLSQPLCLAVVQVADDKSGYMLKKMRSRFPLSGTLVDEVDGALVLISGSVAQQALRDALQVFFDGDARGLVTGIVSKEEAAVSALPDTYQSLLRCLATIATLGRHGAIFLEQELSLYAVLFEKRSPEDIDAFLSSVLGKLYQQGKQRKVELARTLLCYLDHGRNARITASEQRIHLNTLRQRLDSIDALLGNWNDGSRALEVHVALRMWRLRDDKAWAAE